MCPLTGHLWLAIPLYTTTPDCLIMLLFKAFLISVKKPIFMFHDHRSLMICALVIFISACTGIKQITLMSSHPSHLSVCLSVCDVVAPYSDRWTFRQNFFTIWYNNSWTCAVCVKIVGKSKGFYVIVQAKLRGYEKLAKFGTRWQANRAFKVCCSDYWLCINSSILYSCVMSLVTLY